MKSGSANDHTRGSVLLKPEENDQVFRLIGNRCQCQAAGIIQLYLTEPPKHNEWIKKNTGVITLIRDISKRSFFLRLYCIQRKAMLWEHEVYNSMEYKAPLNYFHTFEAEDCMAGFNFASETDAIVLRNILIEKLNAKARRRNERHMKMEMENQRGVTLPRKNQSASTPFLGLTSNTPNDFSNGTMMPVSVNRSMSNISMTKSKKKKRNQEAKKKLTPSDIGLPFDFRHVKHVGTNIDKCRFVDSDLKALFDKVGISESHLQHEETRDFIYDFIESYREKNAIKKESKPSSVIQTNIPKPQPKLEPPPPVPARTIPVSTNTLSSNSNSHQRKAPPLPPSQTQSHIPPAPPNVPPVYRSLPSRPPPPSSVPALVVAPTPVSSPALAPSLPPPPPPPPMPQEQSSKVIGNAPLPPPLPSLSQEDTVISANDNKQSPDPRSMLMQSIRDGISLKKMNKEETKSPTLRDTRSNLLDEIRQGIPLKPVVNEPRPNSATPNVAEGGLAAALTRALAERSRAVMYSDSEDSSDFSDNDVEWDD